MNGEGPAPDLPAAEPPAATPPRLSLEGVSSGYPPIEILHGVDLVAPPGELVALLGPNGAGKTTLLRTVFGLARVTAGRVAVDGMDVTGWPTYRMARLGICYVTQGRAIFRGLSVRENLDMFADGRASADQRERVFAMFPILGERSRQAAGTLSGGQQQMLAMSRALMRPYRLIMVDEVSMGLAPAVIDELFDVLSALKAEGATILLVEQYVERALALADLVYVITSGEVAFAGEPAELEQGGADVLDLYLAAPGG